MQNMSNFIINFVTNYRENYDFMVWMNSWVLLIYEAGQNKSNVFFRLKWFWNSKIKEKKNIIMFSNFVFAVFTSFLFECFSCNKKAKSKNVKEKNKYGHWWCREWY